MTIDPDRCAERPALTVTLNNVKDGFGQTLASVVVPMNVLLGDVNGNNMVNATDIGQVKAQSGASPVTAANFRLDPTVDGSISATDVSMVKSAAGTVIP